MLPEGPHKTALYEARRLLHADKKRESALCIADFAKIKVDIKDDEDPQCDHIIGNMFHWLLNNKQQDEAAQLIWSPDQFDPRPECTQRCWRAFDEYNFGLIMGASSMSKCSSPETPVRKSSGEVVRADEVVVGDVLAGPDGKGRIVEQTVSGTDDMFLVTPTGAPSFKVTGDHLLTLICTVERRNNGGRYGVSSGYTRGRVVDVKVSDYVTWSNQRKRSYRLFSVPAHMPSASVDVDPYVYGAWLGDGTCIRAELTTPEGAMSRRWCAYWAGRGVKIAKINMKGTACKSFRAQSGGRPLWANAWFRDSVVAGAKRIKREYMLNSERVRLAVLAGIIDADGHVAGGAAQVVSKWREFADDIDEIARSLGFKVFRYTRRHSIKSSGFSAEYYHVRIVGKLSKIPTIEKRFPDAKRGMTCGNPTYAFSVRAQGAGEYAGFRVDSDHRYLLGSGIVTHNSYGIGVRLFLEWVRDPEWTTVRVVGPSGDHLEENLFSHLVSLHTQAKIKMPGTIGQLFIGLNRRNLTGAIKGVIIPVGKNKKAAKLQGAKRKPRTTPHPVFGLMSRLFVFLDEIENVPAGVWFDIDNLMSNYEETQQDTLRIFGAYNPSNPGDAVAIRAEPPFGWKDFDVESHYEWDTARGWHVIRLDAEKCENVTRDKVVFPGLQTRSGLEMLAKNSGGRDSAGYHTFGRGAYPPQGAAMSVFAPGLLSKMRAEFVWYDDPVAVAGADLALEGGAFAAYALGRFGRVTGIKYPASIEFPKGHTVMFKGPDGKLRSRMGVQLDHIFRLPSGDSIAVKSSVLDMNRKCGVRPEFFACDRTGAGAGVADLLRHEWSSAIHDVNYSEAASEQKVMQEDTQTPHAAYGSVCSELWFAAQMWGEFQYFLVSPQVEFYTELNQQLTQRHYRQQGKKKRVEPKNEYKDRGFDSPDEADGSTLLVHAARLGSGYIPSMMGDGQLPDDDDDEWPGQGMRIDCSNITDEL